MKNKYYTGVGSRETPEDFRLLINLISEKLEHLGYTLRSGGAEGADTFFEERVTNKEIYYPWGNKGIVPVFKDLNYQLVQEVHPAYNRLSQGALKLHLRNANQVLGKNLDKPSDFLIYWAKTNSKGEPQGGTRTAVLIAKKYGIPCYNLNSKKDYERLLKFVKE